jgi:hypothetical protein
VNGRVVLHIGAMKTGTSFVQSVLGLHPDQLAAAGAEFAPKFARQMHAVQDGLRGNGDFASWNKMVADAGADRTSIISMEFLSFGGPKQVAAFLDPLRGRDVRVVLTVRDQLQTLPAQWQSHSRNFGTGSWETYLREVCRPKPPRGGSAAYRTYHRAQDYAQILSRWADRPEVSRLEVVTVPPPGAPHEELWQRFCRAAGIDVPDVTLAAVKDNPSIGYASCEVLRRVNAELFDEPQRGAKLLRRADSLHGKARKRMPGYRKAVRELVRDSLAALRDTEAKPVVDHAAASWAVARNREVCDVLATGRVGLVGSIDDLPTTATESDFPAVAAPPPEDQVIRAAHTLWDYLAQVTDDSGTRPEPLAELISGSAQMLRRRAAQNS